VEFAEVGNFHMLTNHCFQLYNLFHRLGGNRAVVNVYDNDYMLTGFLPTSEEHCLVDGTLGEAQFIHQDLD
jgi:hypothetical protein